MTALVAFVVLAIAAIYAAETRQESIFKVAKPLTTAALFLVLGSAGASENGQTLVDYTRVALLLSLIGDIALLSDRRSAFMVGLVFFLGAHVTFTLGFLRAAQPAPLSSSAAVGVAVMVIATIVHLRNLWSHIGGTMRGPALAYATAIAVMASSAFLVLGGSGQGLGPIAIAAGAVLFHASDALLSQVAFVGNFSHHRSLVLGFYWAGQLFIVLGVRAIAAA